MHNGAGHLLISGLRGFFYASLTALVMASFSSRFLVATDLLAPVTGSAVRSCCVRIH